MNSFFSQTKYFNKHIVALLHIVFIPFFISPASGQLNCKTVEKVDSTVTTCRHQNGQVSTIQMWDHNERWGFIKAFNSLGSELFSYSLRRFAGHASISLSYHPNGQVKKAEYSSAPDAGIQFYRYIHEYNDVGEQTRYTDLSYPMTPPSYIIHTLKPENEQQPTVEHVVPTQEVMKCAVPYITVFRIANETKRRIYVNLLPQPSLWASLRRLHGVEVLPKSHLDVDSVTLAEKFLDVKETYQIEVVNKKGRVVATKIIQSIPVQTKTRIVYSWHILEL